MKINNASDNVKKITGIALLLAIEIVLQILGNHISLGPISINLSLIPIALGAIMFGPWAGALLGLANGVVVLLAPSTLALFMPYAPLGTVITCLFKCTIAGFVSGIIYNLIKNKNVLLASIVASLLVPVINTGLFALAAFTIILKSVENMNGGNANLASFVFLVMISWNFIFEILVTTILSPTIAKIAQIIKKDE